MSTNITKREKQTLHTSWWKFPTPLMKMFCQTMSMPFKLPDLTKNTGVRGTQQMKENHKDIVSILQDKNMVSSTTITTKQEETKNEGIICN